jgi:predicted exporter
MKDWLLIMLSIGAGVLAALVFCYLLFGWVFGP